MMLIRKQMNGAATINITPIYLTVAFLGTRKGAEEAQVM
jgi:hypothetical protein